MSMFVLLYRDGDRAASPEEGQAQMRKWLDWMKDLGAKGHIKDPGHPLERAGKLVSGRDKVVTDGPFAEAKDVIGGYTLIEAKDLAEATELSKGCPIFEVNGGLEVRPVLSMEM